MEYFDGGPLRHLGDLPAMGAHRYGEKTAFQFYGQSLSYAELDDRADRAARVFLDAGVDPGDRVALMIPNTNEFPVAYFGAIRAGAVPTPLNLRMDPETLGYVVSDAGADVLVGSSLLVEEVTNLAGATELDHLFIENVDQEGVTDLAAAMADVEPLAREAWPDRAYTDVVCQPYTSGTTGRPKGVLLSHENLLSTIEGYAKGGLDLDVEDSMLLVLPFFHIYGLNALMGTCLYVGATCHLQPLPDAANMLQAIDAEEITSFAGVPALFSELYREYRDSPGEYDVSSLRVVNCGAAPLADDTKRAIENAWNVPLTEGWGMTETGPAGTVEPSRGVRKRAGCVGPVVGDVELRIVDAETGEPLVTMDDIYPNPDPDIDFEDHDTVTGELCIRGPTVFEGYYNQPEKTAAAFDDDGWFHTGDIGRVDGDGYFWIVDRADDMIIAGGENIYPAEVEDALYEHPDVAEAAVVGAPHEVKGEAPVAFVVLEAGAEVTEEELRRFTLDHVATYAHPRRIFFVDELPRSATQKVQRFKLEDDLDEYLDESLSSSEEL